MDVYYESMTLRAEILKLTYDEKKIYIFFVLIKYITKIETSILKIKKFKK